ncbi:unnamed protein product [Bursaphelenchus okinawaensis]|uniref:Uncharacterized protein n=1 Tax=Bursaphelenchus okinawaensis TaxID=465554 RepID=A0A811JR77_9BILA|nr:unnamed protein product [Bursaphelenchus okinawaensis]CAG9079786.1 unnamed protein product [Bursaphelenchus okinawaensis]
MYFCYLVEVKNTKNATVCNALCSYLAISGDGHGKRRPACLATFLSGQRGSRKDALHRNARLPTLLLARKALNVANRPLILLGTTSPIASTLSKLDLEIDLLCLDKCGVVSTSAAITVMGPSNKCNVW